MKAFSATMMLAAAGFAGTAHAEIIELVDPSTGIPSGWQVEIFDEGMVDIVTDFVSLREGVVVIEKFAEFIEIVFISMVITTVFFGGWHVPFLHDEGFKLFGTVMYLDHWAVVLLRIGAFGAKVVFFCFLQLAIRWTTPRFRPDQLMRLGWTVLLPLSLFNVMLTALVMVWFAD